MNLSHWILKNGKLKKVDLMTWAIWFENKDGKSEGRITAQTKVGRATVSTVFLGIDHNFTDSKIPILWETMIFGSKHPALSEYQQRYSSLKDAQKGHEDAVRFTKHILNK